jgi:hypothetical protein
VVRSKFSKILQFKGIDVKEVIIRRMNLVNLLKLINSYNFGINTTTQFPFSLNRPFALISVLNCIVLN